VVQLAAAKRLFSEIVLFFRICPYIKVTGIKL